MEEIIINIWRNPPRDEVIVDGEKVPHDVVIRLNFMDMPLTTTLAEFMGTFPYQKVGRGIG